MLEEDRDGIIQRNFQQRTTSLKMIDIKNFSKLNRSVMQDNERKVVPLYKR